MNKLNIPEIGISSEDLFEICARGFINSAKVKKILSYKDKAKACAEEYLRYIPYDIEHFPRHPVKPFDKDELVSLYDEKLSKASFKEARKYYDMIMNSSGGACAICNIGVARTLDHYLPKSEFPLLSVLPANLVPECRECNANKSSFFTSINDQTLLHPYFDDFSNVEWLNVRIDFSSGINFDYYCSFRGDIVAEKRMIQTLEKYKLDELFSHQANSDVANNIHGWKEVLVNSGKKGLYDTIYRSKESREKTDINSWASALYRALINQFEEFANWLNLNA